MSADTPGGIGADLADTRLIIVKSRFNLSCVDGLLAGAVRALAQHKSAASSVVECSRGWDVPIKGSFNFAGAKDAGQNVHRYMIHHVPGALELPLAASWAATEYKPDAIIALGVLLRGDTPHFDYISAACMHGLVQVSLQTTIPVTCGVLTVDNRQQADQRSGADDSSNRGYSAACAAMEMIAVHRRISPDNGKT